MKKFWSKKILGIPMILVLIAAVLLSGGVAFAAYTVLSGGAEVTVEEPIAVAYTGCSSGAWASNTWTVSMYAGETAWIEFDVTKAGTATIVVTPHHDNADVLNITGLWNPINVTLVGAGPQTERLTVTASGSAVPGEYTFNIWFTR